MSVTLRDRAGPWTLEAVAELTDDGQGYEIVDGLLLVSPPELLFNTRLAHRLAQQLRRQAPAPLEVLHELYVRLGTDARRPDVAVIKGDAPVTRSQLGVEARHVVLIVEVVSPSSRKTDRFFKPVEYAAAGVPAYWRVETEPEVVVHVHRLVGDRYEQVREVRGAERVEVPFVVLDGPALVPPSVAG